jgi:hypothetical protein
MIYDVSYSYRPTGYDNGVRMKYGISLGRQDSEQIRQDLGRPCADRQGCIPLVLRMAGPETVANAL